MEKTVKGVADEEEAVEVAAGEAEAISGEIGMVTTLVEKKNLGKTVIIIATIVMATEVVALVETEAVETGEIAKGKSFTIFCASIQGIVSRFFEITKNPNFLLKFIYSEKATKFCKISTNYLSGST